MIEARCFRRPSKTGFSYVKRQATHFIILLGQEA